MIRFVLMVFCVIQIVAADPNEIVNGWLAKQTNVHTWSATFTQTRTIKALTQPLVSTGQVWFAAPQNFRWELGRNQTTAIRSNETLMIIYPRFKRAEKYDLQHVGRSEWKDALALLQSGFPRSRAHFDQQFLMDSVTTNGVLQLNLQPKSTGARKLIPRINVLLTRDLTLRGTELVFADGSRMRNDFSQEITNADVAGQFSLALPADFTIVEPMKGKAR